MGTLATAVTNDVEAIIQKELPEITAWVSTRAEQAIEALRKIGVKDAERVVASAPQEAARLLKQSATAPVPVQGLAATRATPVNAEVVGGEVAPSMPKAPSGGLLEGPTMEAHVNTPGAATVDAPAAGAAGAPPPATPPGTGAPPDTAPVEGFGTPQGGLSTTKKIGIGAGVLGTGAVAAKALTGGPEVAASANDLLAQTAKPATSAGGDGGTTETAKTYNRPSVDAGPTPTVANKGLVDEAQIQKDTEKSLQSLETEKPKDAVELTPAEREAYTLQVDELRKAYKAAAKTNGWAEVAERLGQAIVQYAAARTGLRKGVDLSGVGKQMSTTDWLRKNDQLLGEFKTDLGIADAKMDRREKELKTARDALESFRARKDKTASDGAKLLMDARQGNQRALEAAAGRRERASSTEATTDVAVSGLESADERTKKTLEAGVTKATSKATAATSKDQSKARGAGLGILGAISTTDNQKQKDGMVAKALEKLGAGGIDVPALKKQAGIEAGVLSFESTKLQKLMELAAAEDARMDAAEPAASPAAGAAPAGGASYSYSASEDATYKIVNGTPVEKRAGQSTGW